MTKRKRKYIPLNEYFDGQRAKSQPHYTSTHHMVPKSRGGKSTPPNLTEKDIKPHQAWHVLFQNATPVEIVHIILREWFGMSDWDNDVRTENFVDLVAQVTESKERKNH